MKTKKTKQEKIVIPRHHYDRYEIEEGCIVLYLKEEEVDKIDIEALLSDTCNYDRVEEQ
jgi:hypothetical protein